MLPTKCVYYSFKCQITQLTKIHLNGGHIIYDKNLNSLINKQKHHRLKFIQTIKSLKYILLEIFFFFSFRSMNKTLCFEYECIALVSLHFIIDIQSVDFDYMNDLISLNGLISEWPMKIFIKKKKKRK